MPQNKYAGLSERIKFLIAALERAVKTFAGALGGLLVADGTDVLSTNWGDRFSVAGILAIISVCFSIASAPFGGSGPSLGPEEIAKPVITPGTTPTK